MNPEEECLIELATRPLVDNAELRLAAEAELRKSLEANATDRPEAIAEAADSLARADLHPHRGRRRIALVVIVALISLPLLAHTALQYQQIRGETGLAALCDSVMGNIPRLTPQQKLLLFGDKHASGNAEKWKPLWDSDPKNPAYLAEYALAYCKDHEELSSEILTAAESIDPDNGWFPALAAAGIAKGAVTKESVPYSKKIALLKTPVWKIDDEKHLRDCLSAIHQFAGKPRFTAYLNVLLRQRIPLLPPRRDFVSQIPPMLYMTGQNSTSVQFRKLADVMAAGAQQCAVNGDLPGFHQITGDWKSLVSVTSKSGETMVDVLIAKMIFNSPAANFRDAAQALGLPEEASYFAAIHDRWRQEVDAREKRGKAVTADEDFAIRHGAFLGTILGIPAIGNQVKSPPELTDRDLRPARYADHALFLRFSSWPAWLLLGVCAGIAALARYCHSPLVRSLSGRMVDLMRPSDQAWMIAGGIVFPVLWYFLITRLTPLSAREWSVQASFFIQPSGQFGCMALAIIILPGVIASWRLAKRGGALGLGKRFQWIGWVMAAIALAGVPVFGTAMLWVTLGDKLKSQSLFVLAVAGIWLLVGFSLNVIGRFGVESQALRRATLARIVWPVWVFGMLVLAVLVPFHYAEERRWIQQDEIYKISAEFPGPNRHEYNVTQILRAELLEMIDQAGEIH